MSQLGKWITLWALVVLSPLARADLHLPPPMRVDRVDLRHHVLVLGDRQIALSPNVAVYRGKHAVPRTMLRRGEVIQFALGRAEDGGAPMITKIWIVR